MKPLSSDDFLAHYVRNQSRIYRFIVTLVPGRTDAEELFAQTSLTLWKIRDRFDPSQDFTRWACGIAHNHARNYMRQRYAAMMLLDEDVLDALADLRHRSGEVLDDRRAALADCMAKLPADRRQLIESYYQDEDAIADIAAARGQTTNAVYKELKRLRVTLFNCISRTIAAQNPA